MASFQLKSPDPKEAIVSRFSLLASRNGYCIPNINTVGSLKARTLPMHQLHLITFQDVHEQWWSYTCFLEQNEIGLWYVGSSGGNPTSSKLLAREGDPDPFIYLRGGQQTKSSKQGVTYNFRAGGEVVAKEQPIVRVRLLSAIGSVLEDTVQDDLVLFVSEHYTPFPMEAELYTSSGTMVSKQPVFTFSPVPAALSVKGFFHPGHEW